MSTEVRPDDCLSCAGKTIQKSREPLQTLSSLEFCKSQPAQGPEPHKSHPRFEALCSEIFREPSSGRICAWPASRSLDLARIVLCLAQRFQQRSKGVLVAREISRRLQGLKLFPASSFRGLASTTSKLGQAVELQKPQALSPVLVHKHIRCQKKLSRRGPEESILSELLGRCLLTCRKARQADPTHKPVTASCLL